MQATSALSKKAKTSSDVPQTPSSLSFSNLDGLAEAVSKSGGAVRGDLQPASKGVDLGQWTRKENRSPNLSHQYGLQTESDVADGVGVGGEQVS